jgi:hypothetical protein
MSERDYFIVDPTFDDKAANYFKISLQMSNLIETYGELTSKIETSKKRMREEEVERERVAEQVMEFARITLAKMDELEAGRQKRLRQQDDLSLASVCNEKLDL